MTQKSSLGEKLFLIRKAEGLSRREMEDMTGISQNNLKNYELKGKKIPGETLILILSNPRFRKYSEWVMFDQTNEGAGQISPSLSLDGSCNSEADQDLTQVTQKSPR
ncbi:TPA: helix-turn-helix transcriptional regulator [Escherichia coli]|nr:helix-turn-helix transcriptional regulator [Escherichia coli]